MGLIAGDGRAVRVACLVSNTRCGVPPPLEAHEPIVRRVLVGLASCGHRESGVDEPVDGASLVHDKLPDVDEFTRDFTHDVYTDQDLVLHPED